MAIEDIIQALDTDFDGANEALAQTHLYLRMQPYLKRDNDFQQLAEAYLLSTKEVPAYTPETHSEAQRHDFLSKRYKHLPN